MATPITMTFSDSPRGVCDICGKPAYAPQAKKCEDHRGKRTSSSARAPGPSAPTGAPEPDFRIGTPGPPPETRSPAEVKSDRADWIAEKIKTEVNPQLAQGLAMACRPVPTVNFYEEKDGKVVPCHFGEAVTFGGLEVWVLSHAAAELETSPMAKTVANVAGPVLPIALAVGAALVVGAKGYRVLQLREDIMTKWRNEAAAAQGATPQAPAGAPEPTPQAPTAATPPPSEGDVPPTTEPAPYTQRTDLTSDIDLGPARPPAVDVTELPDIDAQQTADLADLLS